MLRLWRRRVKRCVDDRMTAHQVGWAVAIGFTLGAVFSLLRLAKDYLHERHRSLAPELAATLQEMKAEGRHERYLTEALIANAMERGVPRARAEAETEIFVKALLSEQ